MTEISKEIQNQLFLYKDEKFKDFQVKLTPTICPERVIGVRTPLLRSYAKKLAKRENIEDYLNDLPHKYFEENNLHGFIVSELKDYDKTVNYVDEILPYVDNWATCDLLSPKVFKKNKDKLKFDIDRWISSSEPFTIRFGIEMAMSHFLDDDFDISFFDKISKLRSDEYYVNMMIAWFFATALAKQWDYAIPYIENNKLDKWCHNKTIQKAIESYRIDDKDKNYLRSLKIK